MSDDKPYWTDSDGVTRISPCQKMVISGVVRGAGTIIKLETKQVNREAVKNG